MKICSKEMAAIVFGAGGASGITSSFTSPAPQQSGTISSTPSFSSNSSGSNTSASSGGRFMSWLGNITGTDSGVTNGVRDDGRPLGDGCGDAKTDHLVPDTVFGHDLTGGCFNHDIGYSTPGASKQAVDAQLAKDVSQAMGGGILGAVVGGLFHVGVSLGGQDAYNRAQSDAAGGGGGVATGGNGGDASGGGDRGTRGGF